MGLIRGIARTAVIAGTATATSNRVSRRQQARWEAKEQTVEPTRTAPVRDDLTADLDRLTAMRENGRLTDEEFAAAKAKLLGM